METKEEVKSEYGPVFETGVAAGRGTYGLVFGPSKTVEESAIFAKLEDGSLLPFEGFRHRVKIQLETYNHVFDGKIVGAGLVKFTIDGTAAFSYRFSDLTQAVARIPVVLEDLMAFPPLALGWSHEIIQRELIGRKVFYRDQPAVVTEFHGYDGEVTLVPDGIESFTPAAHLRGFSDGENETEPKISILSGDVWWWRSE